MVVTVPQTLVPTSATKHPSGLRARNRRQSAAVWFHPASSFNRIPAGMSALVITRSRMVPVSTSGL
jgi:hypothetical protein